MPPDPLVDLPFRNPGSAPVSVFLFREKKRKRPGIMVGGRELQSGSQGVRPGSSRLYRLVLRQ